MKNNLKWMFKTHPHIQITTDKEIINTKNGRKRKMCVNGYSTGVWLDKKTFVIKSKINDCVVPIPKKSKLVHDPFFGSHL